VAITQCAQTALGVVDPGPTPSSCKLTSNTRRSDFCMGSRAMVETTQPAPETLCRVRINDDFCRHADGDLPVIHVRQERFDANLVRSGMRTTVMP
jgi:hypothetical protein